MEIVREVYGMKKTFTLTPDELASAFAEEQANRDIKEARKILEEAIKDDENDNKYVEFHGGYFTVKEIKALIADDEKMQKIAHEHRTNTWLNHVIGKDAQNVLKGWIKDALSEEGIFWKDPNGTVEG